MRCDKCKYWGAGEGYGSHYDAGAVNYCNQPQISGNQHASYGACGEPTSMVITTGEDQHVMTRWNFGCILFVERDLTKGAVK
jgi:hypothetical protein